MAAQQGLEQGFAASKVCSSKTLHHVDQVDKTALRCEIEDSDRARHLETSRPRSSSAETVIEEDEIGLKKEGKLDG